MAVSDDAAVDRGDRSAADAFPTKNLPRPEVRNARLAMLIWAIVLFGTLSVLTFRDQIARLLGG